VTPRIFVLPRTPKPRGTLPAMPSKTLAKLNLQCTKNLRAPMTTFDTTYSSLSQTLRLLADASPSCNAGQNQAYREALAPLTWLTVNKTPPPPPVFKRSNTFKTATLVIGGPQPFAGEVEELAACGGRLSFEKPTFVSSFLAPRLEKPTFHFSFLASRRPKPSTLQVSNPLTSQVVLDQAALEKEKRRLLDDNAKLKYVLKQYLDGITVNAEVLKDPKNPLLVRQGSCLLPGSLKRDRRWRKLDLYVCGVPMSWRVDFEICVKWAGAHLT
jgi:hypothetical protein